MKRSPARRHCWDARPCIFQRNLTVHSSGALRQSQANFISGTRQAFESLLENIAVDSSRAPLSGFQMSMLNNKQPEQRPILESDRRFVYFLFCYFSIQ